MLFALCAAIAFGGTATASISEPAPLEQKYEQAKAAYEADKSDQNKGDYVDAAVALGTQVMNDGGLPPREKYPRALNLYREALQLDPGNQEALANKALIEGIYESMNRPIPQ